MMIGQARGIQPKDRQLLAFHFAKWVVMAWPIGSAMKNSLQSSSLTRKHAEAPSFSLGLYCSEPIPHIRMR
jgi:hypothetical protein